MVLASGLVLWLSHSPETFGIGRGVWRHTHIHLSLVMGAAAILHSVLNWSVFWSYLWPAKSGRTGTKWEAILALILVALIVGTSVYGRSQMKRQHGPPDAHRVERQKQ